MTFEEQKLVDQIHGAFAGVKLEDGTSLIMAEDKDGGGMPEFSEEAKADEREDWTAIPGGTLEQFTVTFSFTDLKGFRFYIPAYMIWTVRNHRISECFIADATIYAIHPDHYLFETTSFCEWFTPAQVDAMADFLEFAAQNDETLDSKVARENLAKIRKAQQCAGGNAASPRAPA